MNPISFETFPLLTKEKWLRHGFILRVPHLTLEVDKTETLTLLEKPHRATITELGLANKNLITADQVHGNRVVRVTASTPALVINCDGLITNDPAVMLGIYTADCGAIYLADPENRAIGLLHSGKKGTELNILGVAIDLMLTELGSKPENLLVQLSPCIRPPHYEIDFATDIAIQARASGILQYADSGECTADNQKKYYSYRREMGRTGRHLAVLGYAD